MRKFIALFALTLALAGSQVVWASSFPAAEDAQNQEMGQVTITVYNDSGATLASGAVVVWDQGDTDVTESRRPYVTTSTTASDPYTAGVIKNTCGAGDQCEMIVYGLALVRCFGDCTAGDLVAVGGPSGTAVDHSAAADNRAIGTALQTSSGNYTHITVLVSSLGIDGQ